jgi:hypothetical protein
MRTRTTARSTMRRGLISGAVVLSLLLGLAPVPASAATNPYTPREVCGSSYREVHRHSIVGGVIYLMYSGGYNCAVTIKTRDVGTKTRVGIGLTRLVDASEPWKYDPPGGPGSTTKYKYYAGPVKVYAPHECVAWHGWTAYDTWDTWGACD